MNTIKFILFIGLASQICAQLDINYFRINNIPLNITTPKVLEVDPFYHDQGQWDWFDFRWQQWIIYWVDQPNGLAMIYDRHNYRALTATSATTFETKFIFPRLDPNKDSQIWKIDFGILNGNIFWLSTIESTKYPDYVIAPSLVDFTNGLPWTMEDCANCGLVNLEFIASMAENFDIAFNYKILGWENPARALDFTINRPQVWTISDTDNQKMTFTVGTCNGQTAYKIADADGRYIVSDGGDSVVTYSSAPPDEARSGWWHLRTQYDYYDLAYKIENCRDSGKYLTFPDVDVDGNAFYLSSTPPGLQGHFYLRKM